MLGGQNAQNATAALLRQLVRTAGTHKVPH